MFKAPVFKNSMGEKIILNSQEKHTARWLANQLSEKHGSHGVLQNALGYDIAITTLTTITKKISEQVFYRIPPADYLPVVVGQGSYSDFLTTYRSFQMGGNFADGILNTGDNNTRLASVSAGVDALNIKVFPWGKALGWSIFQLEYAAKSGNWDLVAALEEARITNWQLGIQDVAMLGLDGNNGATGQCFGLLNQPAATVNANSFLTIPISTMTTAQLKTFTAGLIELYRNNVNRTCWPDRFVIPESDYNGMASQASPDFPIKSTLQLLEEAFKLITRNEGFRILPLAYADGPYHPTVTSLANQQVYSLYRSDEKSLNMNVPLPYTTTVANSLDNFGFQNVGFGQFTGVILLRPLELMYFTFPTSQAVI
jgi:hypothetical protein